MAWAECASCGGRVDMARKNYIFANGMHQHKKCPTPKTEKKLTSEEALQRRELTDTINKFTKEQGRELTRAEWSRVVNQIKQLKNQGFSYRDQLKVFNWHFHPSKNNEYKGYGIMLYVINRCLQEIEEHEKEKKISEISKGAKDEINRIMEERRKARLRGGLK